jgi:hypothetical protein
MTPPGSEKQSTARQIASGHGGGAVILGRVDTL